MNKLRVILKFTALIGILVQFLQTSLYAETTNEQHLGARDYINNCAVCHGVDGKGNGPMAEQLTKPPKDLTLLSKENGGSFPETAVYQIIDGRRIITFIDGRRVNIFHGPQEMPIWGDRFRAIEGDEGAVDERISNIIEYLESIQVE